MKNLILLIAALMVCTACTKEPQSEKPRNLTHDTHVKSAELYGMKAQIPSPNFIASYVIPTSIGYVIEPIPVPVPDGTEVGWSNNDDIWTEGDYQWKLNDLRFILTFRVDKPDFSYMGNAFLNHTSGGGGKEFMKLAQKFNDTDYDGKYWVSEIVFSPMQYFTVTCDKDFDAAHPAGTPLDDIINVNYFSAEKFINSSYSDMDAGNSNAGFNENLAKLNKKNINLHTGFTCVFNAQPTQAGIYRFTVEYKNADGTILVKTLPSMRLRAQ